MSMNPVYTNESKITFRRVVSALFREKRAAIWLSKNCRMKKRNIKSSQEWLRMAYEAVDAEANPRLSLRSIVNHKPQGADHKQSNMEEEQND